MERRDGLKGKAEGADALDEFSSEGAAPDAAEDLRENPHQGSTVAQNAAQPLPELSDLRLQQNDSTIALRPAKDRRKPIGGRRFRLSGRTCALVALAAVLGGGAFALFKVWVASRGTLTSAVLRAPSGDGAARADTTKADAISSTPAPSPVATVAAVEARAGQDLTGWWVMTNQVQASSYGPYQGLRIGYRLRLRQEGTRIVGHGHKLSENGRAVPRASRTPITVAGVRKSDRIALTFSERGRRRRTQGAFDLQVISARQLRGKFESDAARSRGSSVAERVRNDDAEREEPELKSDSSMSARSLVHARQ